jgi:hypothetical protein
MACPLCGCEVHATDGQEAALTQALWMSIDALNSEALVHHSLGETALADAALRDAALLRDFIASSGG